MAQNLITTKKHLRKLHIKLLTLGVSALVGMVSLSVIQANATQIATHSANVTKADSHVPSEVFAVHKEKQLYDKRLKAAKDLEAFLAGRIIPAEGREAFNRKLIQIGIKVLDDGKVEVMSNERWKELYKTLKPNEIVDIHDPKLQAKIKEREERMLDAENQEQSGLIDLNRAGDDVTLTRLHRDAPVINLKVSDKTDKVVVQEAEVQEEEEDEESPVKRLDPNLKALLYQKRIDDRANKVKNFLFYSFDSAINHHRNGKRRTIVNSYLDDTIKHYNDKVMGR